MPLSDLAKVQISLQAPGIPLAGFGVPLILSQNAGNVSGFTTRTRSYASLAALAVDFPIGTPEYGAAAALFGQPNAPSTVMVGRAVGSITQKWTVAVVTSTVGGSYQVNLTDATGQASKQSFLFVLAAATAWTTGKIYQPGAIVTSGGDYFVCTAGGVAGAVAPTATSGTVTDGSLIWQAEASSLAAAQNDAAIYALEAALNAASGAAYANNGYYFGGTTANPCIVKSNGNYYQLTGGGVAVIGNTAAAIGGQAANAPTGTGVYTDPGGSGLVWTYLGTTAPLLSAASISTAGTVGNPAQNASPAPLQLVVSGASTSAWIAVEINDPTMLQGCQNHAAPTNTPLATDLAAIANENNAWYFLLTLYDSPAYIEACAAWINGLGSYAKLYFPCSTETAVAINAPGTNDFITGAVDDCQSLKVSGYTGTAAIFHPRASEWAAAAEVGYWAPSTPGTENWRAKPLAGVTTGWGNGQQYTGTQLANICAAPGGTGGRNANYYYDIFSGTSIVGGQGLVAAGEYIDVIRYVSSWINDVETRCVNVLVQAPKVPFTDVGIALLEGEVRAAIQDGIDVGAINPGSPPGIAAPVVTVPKAGSVSAANRTARTLSGITATFTLAGAINELTVSATVLQ